MVRTAVFAGSFYPAGRGQILQVLEQLWPDPAPERQKAMAAMVPHAGYVYSGRTAAEVYARLERADTYVLVGPNHTGRGRPVAVAAAQAWETPLGKVPMETGLSRAILEHCAQAQADDLAHEQEHSLEVQLPFLQKSGEPFSLVCIALGTHDPGVLRRLGEAMAKAINAYDRRVMIIASSDMNHFEDLETTRRLDQMALEQVEAMDPEGLLRVVRREGISMCGAGPAAAMLFAARSLGAAQVQRVAYATSADASGDRSRVVGYAGVLVR